MKLIQRGQKIIPFETGNEFDVAGVTVAWRSHVKTRIERLEEEFSLGRKGKFHRWRDTLMAHALDDSGCDATILENGFFDLLSIGVNMETTRAALEAVNDEVKESREILQKLHNEIKPVAEVVLNQLLDFRQHIRDSRMTVVRESREIMTELRDIRKFFLEDDYHKEIENMERFIALCRQIEEMKKTGLFDAVADTIIKLALKGEK